MHGRPALVLCGLLLASCGDDGSQGAIDAPAGADAAIDGAADAGFDADPSLLPLIGTWNRAPEADPDTGFDSITFHADGTTAIVDNGGTQTGTFSVPATGRVHLDPDGSPPPIETDFVVGGNHLILTAFLPQGTVTGFVGTWKNETTTGTMPMTTTSIDVRADHTATLMLGTATFVGTWADESTGFVFNATTPIAVTYHFRPIGTQAIGYLYYVKS
jgi:hypothetical protein